MGNSTDDDKQLCETRNHKIQHTHVVVRSTGTLSYTCVQYNCFRFAVHIIIIITFFQKNNNKAPKCNT